MLGRRIAQGCCVGLVVAALGCGPKEPDETSTIGSAASSGATSTGAGTEATSTSTTSTGTMPTSTAPLTTTDGSTSASSGAVGTTNFDPSVCEAAALLELKDPVATPDMGPSWQPGESVTIGVTLRNPGAQDFTDYPGIRVVADHPGVTAAMPENWLFALLAGMENMLTVTLTAAPDLPAPATITVTIELALLNHSCPGLASIELPVSLK